MSVDQIAELRREVGAYAATGSPSERYLAKWLLFYMDAHDRTMQAWQDSICDTTAWSAKV